MGPKSLKNSGAGEGNRTPDLRFTNSFCQTDSEHNQQLSEAKSEQVRQNPQPPRNHFTPQSEKPGPCKGDEGSE
jgi:hypothetical protein